MTLKQREKLYHILGSIEGLTWGVEDPHISEGFCGVAEDLGKLLEEDWEYERQAIQPLGSQKGAGGGKGVV